MTFPMASSKRFVSVRATLRSNDRRMNKTERNPKCDPRAGDLLWRPAANGQWQCIQVHAVTRAFVRLAPSTEPDAAYSVSLPHWQRETATWRLAYPAPANAEPAWVKYWPRPRERFTPGIAHLLAAARYDERRE